MKKLPVSRKIFATISDHLADRLQQRADDEGRSFSDLVGYLLEFGMEGWEEKRELRRKLKEEQKKRDQD